MLRLHTSKDSESIREALRRLIAGGGRASGQIAGDTFRLSCMPKSRGRGIPVTLYGRIAAASDGTLISAWSCPHWAVIIGFPLWSWWCLADHTPIWFIAIGFLVGVINYVFETRKGYDLLREIGAGQPVNI